MTAARTARLLPLVAACLLAACTRTVEWDEEVLLNTGETMWVHRTANYRWTNSTPIPFDWSYEPDRQNAIAFDYRGSRYAYEGQARLQVLAISPQGVPNLVISAADWNWQWQHDYRCVRPSYVQLQPAADGTTWTWPPRIENWLFGLPTNLLMRVPKPGEKPPRLDPAEKAGRNLRSYAAGQHMQKIDPTYQTDHCKGQS